MIKLTEVTKYYCSDTSVALGLRKVNLEFKSGEFVAITGESGSGKSTLLNVIGGMDTYEEGEMFVGTEPTSYYGPEDWEEYRRNDVSLIYQSYNLIESYTAIQNIESVLLLCEKNIGKTSKKERKKIALSYLDKVGLKNKANQKAARLSSGQKQRLTIARALAKNTGIIIADEPTGNLDSENSKQIIELLHELSRDKLVIVVTHNYEEVANYATRKVRLFDGEVVEDKMVNPPLKEIKDPQKVSVHQEVLDEARMPFKQKAKRLLKKLGVSWQIVTLNRRSQPRRNLFIFTFIMFIMFSIFTFFGTMYGSLDDTLSKYTITNAYTNLDQTRLVVRKFDGSVMKEKDFDNLKEANHIYQAEKYDISNDVNYYYEKNKDYRISYSIKGEDGLSNKIKVEFLDTKNFMKSQSCISKDDLKKGRLPENMHEVVLHSNDESLLGKELDFYFTSEKNWGKSDYAKYTLVVVGLLKDSTNQVYFGEELAKTMSLVGDEFLATASYVRVKDVKYDTDEFEDYIFETKRELKGIYLLNDKLPENTIAISNEFIIRLDSETIIEDKGVEYEYISEKGTISYNNIKESSKEEINVNVSKQGHGGSSNIVEISRDLFDKMFVDQDIYQMSLYMDHYAYTDRVIKNLESDGYEAISVLRTSVTTFDEEKLSQRMSTVLISLAALAGVFFLSVVVLYGMMKLKRGDFIILQSLGMDHVTVKQINNMDLIFNIIVASGITFIGMKILAIYKVSAIVEIIHYYEVSHYLMVVMIGIGIALTTAYFYNRHLLKRLKITSLRSE